ncbi:response regulator [Phenylobacterium montanum]|uniref:Response regulator n=1 Tax=Phenylobacterium montanum TaxID=2823693 RepID=A0A975FWF7_9CAUL|nr:response regulator [Caulobacter sp. S6]QUD86197.1 response regulator [Caulobacter sp. S6]
MSDRTGLGGFHILVIDDNAQMRTIIGTVLAAAGVRNLHYAQDGREGLVMLAQRPIDVVFVDLEMPVMNGLAFIRAARALEGDKRRTPIIMLTGHSDTPSVLRARDLGVDEFLGKPVTAKSILQRLEMVIFRQRAFVIAQRYVGPDRRRRTMLNYAGPRRRASELVDVLEL